MVTHQNVLIKRLSKHLLSRLVRHDGCWRLLDFLLFRVARFADCERQDVVFQRQVAEAVRAGFPDLTVRNGPFKGLRYPSADALFSAILPKLLGSYEMELQPAIERVCRNHYDLVVDVGCAEGYYAIGLAIRLIDATVHAFDTDERARELCSAMAVLNLVGDRVLVRELCSSETLRSLVGGRRALVVCDCEGFELDLLTPEIIPALAASDLLVETHEFGGRAVVGTLVERLGITHDVAIVPSSDDDAKARLYSYSEIASLDWAARRFILAERRPAIMEWLVASPRAGRAASLESNTTLVNIPPCSDSRRESAGEVYDVH
jgi:hypothetical protein